MKIMHVTSVMCVVLGLLALSSAALAQVVNPVEPALPGSVQYQLTANHYTWIQTSDPIDVGVYVEDLLSDFRWNQPVGRGRVGIVTATSWDEGYHTMAAVIDFGRDYSVGIVFREITAIQLVAVPEPSSLLILISGIGFIGIRIRRR